MLYPWEGRCALIQHTGLVKGHGLVLLGLVGTVHGGKRKASLHADLGVGRHHRGKESGNAVRREKQGLGCVCGAMMTND